MFSKLKSTGPTIIFSLLCLATFSANPEPKPTKSTQSKGFLSKLKNSKAGKFVKKHKKKIAAGALLGTAATAAITKYCICKIGTMPASLSFSRSDIDYYEKQAIVNLKTQTSRFEKLKECGTDGIIAWPKTLKNPDKLVVWMMGNGELCQERFSEASSEYFALIEKTGCPMLVLNYAGVGNSEGFPSSFDRVEKKLEREIEQAEKKFGFDSKKTVIIGHSIGGYLGSEVARKRKNPFFSNRSLCSMSKTASELTNIPHVLTKPLFWGLVNWEHDAAKAFAELEHCDHAYSTKDSIIKEKASLHEGLKRLNHPQKGHSLIPTKKLSPKEEEIFSHHNCQLVELKCKDCGKTLFDLIVDFIEQN